MGLRLAALIRNRAPRAGHPGIQSRLPARGGGTACFALICLAILAGCQPIRSTRSHPPLPTAEPPSDAATAARAKPADSEPLLLEGGPGLLPEDGIGLTMSADKNAADNSRCQVCHLNLVGEPLALTHASAGIGCAECHGPSDAHIADESWASGGNGTPPDIMFPKPRINPGCQECHPRETLAPDSHGDFLVSQREGKLCTDCHGEHRLHDRRCNWK